MNVKTNMVTRECLTAATRLQPVSWLAEFYLAGGTALALYYQHRTSVDLDFFSSHNQLQPSDRRTLLKDLIPLEFKIEDEQNGTLQGMLSKTHVSFMTYPYPLMKQVRKWNHLSLAHPIDIGLMKIGAIIGRGSKKDFYDLYEILNREISLFKLLKLGQKKYTAVSDFPLQSLRAMVYFIDADKEPEPRKVSGPSWPQIKLFFEQEVRKIGKNWIH